MYRFTMPDTGLSISEQADAIRMQLDQFEGSDALRALLELVGADRYTLREKYNGRVSSGGLQNIQSSEMVRAQLHA